MIITGQRIMDFASTHTCCSATPLLRLGEVLQLITLVVAPISTAIWFLTRVGLCTIKKHSTLCCEELLYTTMGYMQTEC